MNPIRYGARLKKFLPALLLWSCLACPAVAQDKLFLHSEDSKNKQVVSHKLYDNHNGDFLLELPLTFHVTADNILFMIVGGDKGLNTFKTVWLFNKFLLLEELTKKNKNLAASKRFKKGHDRVEPVLQYSDNIELLADFQNDYEHVRETPRIVFFRIKNTDAPLELKLKFYVSEAAGKYRQQLMAEAGTVTTVIHIVK